MYISQAGASHHGSARHSKLWDKGNHVSTKATMQIGYDGFGGRHRTTRRVKNQIKSL